MSGSSRSPNCSATSTRAWTPAPTISRSKEDDPAFGGFHRIEKALFADKSTAGMAPLADQLMHDVLELQSRIGALVIPPNKMVGGAASI